MHLAAPSISELAKEYELQQELDYRACEDSLYRFFLAAWKVLEPTTPLYSNWHLELMAEYLEEVTAGNIRRIIINVPPRSLKSTLVTICWPCWEWIKNPSERYMFASYSQSLSTEHSMARRRLIESEWYSSRWGSNYGLLEDQNAKHYFRNDGAGHMFATSTGGSATGFGGNRVIIDDPHNTKGAESDAERTTTLNDIDKGLMSRFNDPKTGVLALVMQRLHEEDATGNILKKDLPGLVHVKLPTEATENQTIIFPRSGRVVHRKTGELLHPERMGPDEVAAAKKLLGSFGFAGQHQQEPAPLEGGILKVDNWQRYTPALLPEQFDQIVQSWDMRFKKTTSEQAKNKGDYVAGVVLGIKGSRTYLLDLTRGLWGFKDSRDQVVLMSGRWPHAVQKFVENKANGPGIVDALEEEIAGLTLIEPKGDKMQRAMLTVPYHEAHNLFIPEKGHVFSSGVCVDDFVTECAKFPNGKNDDMLDAYTQGVIELHSGGLAFLRAMAGQSKAS